MKKSILKKIIKEEIQNIKEDTSADFDKLVKALTKKKLNVSIKLIGNKIYIELGYNYSSKLSNKVHEVLEDNGMPENDVSISAQIDGGKVIKNVNINGGIRRV